MITAIDTNVILDILSGQEPHARSSALALLAARRVGTLVASDVVWAETAAWFSATESLREAMDDLGIRYDGPSQRAATIGGEIWRAYRADGGSRARLVPDFLVGAHALVQADRLLTRDRGFFRRYFTALQILDPRHA